MRYYYREKDYLYIGFEYQSSIMNYLKKMGARYNPATKEWYLLLSLDKSMLLNNFLKSNGFKNKRVLRERDIELKPIDCIVDKEDVNEMLEYIDFPITLRDYQLEGLTYMINHSNCINGCGCGLGKTIQSIAYAELLKLFPCIVICPSTVKKGWEKEWIRCNPNRTIHIIDSSDSEDTDWKADVTIINYDYLFKRDSKKGEPIKLRYSRSLSKKWNLVILDEIHLCKNKNALRSKSVSKITSKANKVIALSGTVIMNRPNELINILKILNRFEDIFPSEMYFLYRYCLARKTRFGLDYSGASYTLELNDIIRHYCYFRKEKREVLKELPPIIEQTIDSSITNKKEYRKAEDDFIEYLRGIDIEKAERALRAEYLVRLTGLKQLSIKGKLKFIIQFLKDWKESDEDQKLIVFGNTVETLKALHNTFPKDSELVIGEGKTEDKLKKVESWKRDKQFLFANIATLSTGVDGLQDCCSNMVFIELSGPKDMEQSISRIERMGQKNSITIYYILSSETIDADLYILLKEKQKIVDEVNKGINMTINDNKSMDYTLIKRLQDKKNKCNKFLNFK